MSVFNREEIYIGYSGSEFRTAMDALNDAKIKYYLKRRNMGGLNRTVPGTDINYSIQNVISVDEKDADSAKYFINKALQDRR